MVGGVVLWFSLQLVLIDELVVRAAGLGAEWSCGVRGPVWGRGDSGRER